MFKNISSIFGNHINFSIFILLLFIILLCIINKGSVQESFNTNNNINHNLIQNNQHNKFVESIITNGKYFISNIKGIDFKSYNLDKFGFNKTNIDIDNDKGYWNIKKINNYYVLDKPNSKSCLSIDNNNVKSLFYEDCTKKTLCSVDLSDDNEEKLKTSYLEILNYNNHHIIKYNNNYLCLYNNHIKLENKLNDNCIFQLNKIVT